MVPVSADNAHQSRVCVDMCMYMRIGMSIYISLSAGNAHQSRVCIDMCIDMCICMCIDMCICMCIYMCIGTCIDVSLYRPAMLPKATYKTFMSVCSQLKRQL